MVYLLSLFKKDTIYIWAHQGVVYVIIYCVNSICSKKKKHEQVI